MEMQKEHAHEFEVAGQGNAVADISRVLTERKAMQTKKKKKIISLVH
jgi:hypothetical protein